MLPGWFHGMCANRRFWTVSQLSRPRQAMRTAQRRAAGERHDRGKRSDRRETVFEATMRRPRSAQKLTGCAEETPDGPEGRRWLAEAKARRRDAAESTARRGRQQRETQVVRTHASSGAGPRGQGTASSRARLSRRLRRAPASLSRARSTAGRDARARRPSGGRHERRRHEDRQDGRDEMRTALEPDERSSPRPPRSSPQLLARSTAGPVQVGSKPRTRESRQQRTAVVPRSHPAPAEEAPLAEHRG